MTRKVTRGGVNRPGRELLSGLKNTRPIPALTLDKDTSHIVISSSAFQHAATTSSFGK